MKFWPVMENEDFLKRFFKKYKVSRPEPSWVVFYWLERIIYRTNVISRIKMVLCPNFALRNTVSIAIKQLPNIIRVTLSVYFTNRSGKYRKNPANSFCIKCCILHQWDFLMGFCFCLDFPSLFMQCFSITSWFMYYLSWSVNCHLCL